MAREHVERRLTAILAADVVRYSQLMGADEAGTRRRFNAHLNELIEPAIASNRGRVFKAMGDGLLVEFASVVDAVECAVMIQKGMEQRNCNEDSDARVDFRIGVNLGDVIIEDQDIHGDGVNIASRLEGLANPGGICVSSKVWEEVRGKINVDFADIGRQRIKNISEPIRAYHAVLDQDGGASRSLAMNLWPVVHRWRGVGPLVLISLLITSGLVAWSQWKIQNEGNVEQQKTSAQKLNDKSIAVLPFTNISGDAEQDYFAEGMADDIITDLSKILALVVVARKSSFQYKDQNIEVRRIGRELGARYLLQGSVRRAGDRVRINAQLVDASTGAQIWAERYDGGLEDTFSLQDKVTSRIIKAMSIKLVAGEKEKLAEKGTTDIDAHDAYLKGQSYARRYTADGLTLAIKHYEKALALDPNYSRAAKALKNARFIKENSGLR